MYACGGIKSALPDQNTLWQLAQEMFGNTSISNEQGVWTSKLSIVSKNAAPFLAKSPWERDGYQWFDIWSQSELSSQSANRRYFTSSGTIYDAGNDRHYPGVLAICVE